MNQDLRAKRPGVCVMLSVWRSAVFGTLFVPGHHIQYFKAIAHCRLGRSIHQAMDCQSAPGLEFSPQNQGNKSLLLNSTQKFCFRTSSQLIYLFLNPRNSLGRRFPRAPFQAQEHNEGEWASMSPNVCFHSHRMSLCSDDFWSLGQVQKKVKY